MANLPTMHVVNGVIVPDFIIKEELDKLKDIPLRADDVWVVAYPKCGTTWTEHIVTLIRNGGEEDTRNVNEAVPWLEAIKHSPHVSPDFNVDDLPSPRAFSSHFSYNLMPCGLPMHTPCKYVYVARNPKDVAVSLYYHFRALDSSTLVWDEFIQDFIAGNVMFGNYFDHVLSWWGHKDDQNILFLKYEDMKKDLADTVRKIAKFIDCDFSDAVVEEVVKKASFTSMKANPKSNFSWMKRNPGEQPFLRKGVVGDWKNHFSAEQSAQLDEVYQSRMKGTGLEFEFK